MNEMIVEVTDSTFQNEVLGSVTPVVVDFWAPWCAPCKLVDPLLDELANEYAGKYKFVRMNTDINTQVPNEYAIRTIPTIGIFSNGRMVDIIIGARPKQFIKSKLDENLSSIGSGQDEEPSPMSTELY
ncbi:MAG TPA: thioredoxin [Bacteroidota bacterium]|nr:thioredoxin [Bacteroidota bacterium]